MLPENDDAPRWLTSCWRLTIALTALTALTLLLAGDPFQPQERSLFDIMLRRGFAHGWTRPADPRICILGFDDTDFAGFPDLGAEYRAIAEAIGEASDLGAATVVLDVVCARGTQAMSQPILDAIANGPPVVLAEAEEPAVGGGAARRLRSFPFLAVPERPAGLINIEADPDGIYRSYSLIHWNGTSYEPSLALAAYLAVQHIDWGTDVTQPSPGVMRWQGPNGSVEGDWSAPPLLNFRGPWAAGAGFRHLSLRRLRELRGASAAGGRQPLAGTIIFLTNTATGIADLGATPFGPNQPLVLLHATALNDLFQGSFIRRPPRWVDALSLLIVPLFATLFPLCPRKRILVIAWLLGTSVVLVAGAALLFRFHVAPATFTIMLLWSACTVAELARRHTCEWHARQRLRDTMSLYFSPRVLDAVIKDPGNLSPKKVGITVLLTDLRNSTPLAELLGADGMLELLNQVFELENRAVFEADGSLEKPVGDQFLAYWGAPEPQPDAADRAVRAALALIESMEAFRASCETQVRRLFGYGVALHAGRSLIGNIGSAQFFHYGPVGDVLNATARIESLTKYYGVLMIMTREVYSKLTAPPCARVLDEVIVKGKSSPLELIEIEHKFNAANFKELAARYGDAFQLYKAGNFTEAGQLFRALAATDKPSEAMGGRCAALQANPPEEWTGIFRMETK